MSEKNISWDLSCPIYQLFDLLGKKWTIFILFLIDKGNTSFSSLQKKLSKINSKILTERLDILVERWYVQRDVTPTKPLKITYTLTKEGKELAEKIHTLWMWAGREK